MTTLSIKPGFSSFSSSFKGAPDCSRINRYFSCLGICCSNNDFHTLQVVELGWIRASPLPPIVEERADPDGDRNQGKEWRDHEDEPAETNQGDNGCQGGLQKDSPILLLDGSVANASLIIVYSDSKAAS